MEVKLRAWICATARGPGGFGEDGCAGSQPTGPGDAPRALPSRDRGPAAPRAGAPRESSRGTPWFIVVGEIRALVTAAWRNRRAGSRSRTAAQHGSTALAGSCYIWRHAVYASYGCKPARLCRFVSPRAPHATHRPGSPHCSHCQSSATRHSPAREFYEKECPDPPRRTQAASRKKPAR